MQRKGKRVNPILGDQSGIPISHLRAKANKRRGDHVVGLRNTRTLGSGRIVSFGVVPYNHRKLDWSDSDIGTTSTQTIAPPSLNSIAGISLWPTGGGFVDFTTVLPLLLFDGGLAADGPRDPADLGGPKVSGTEIRDGGKAV